jgi:precorrin-2 dehydrogenase/sirohydrochlorin ferrochelatase
VKENTRRPALGYEEDGKMVYERSLEKHLLPLYLDLTFKLVVILGGGNVGERKAKLFSQYSCVRVVSKDFTDGLVKLGRDGAIELVKADLWENYDRYLDGAFIVIPATNDAKLNRIIEQKATDLGIMVNKIDGVGDLVVPSILRRDPITIAISTESPALSKYLRVKLEKELQEDYQGMARLLLQIRKELKEVVPLQKHRSKIIWSILQDEEVWRLLRESYEKAYMRAREHAMPDE